MGTRGPVPKRSEERIRRNKPEVEVTKVSVIGTVKKPKLGIEDPHPLIQDFWDSLQDSAQSQFYEPSDWQYARYLMHFANDLVRSSRPSGQMFAAVQSGLQDLLVSEGARRRVQMEVERNKATGQVIDIAGEFRRRMEGK